MAKDPHYYFRIEARELLDGLNRDALELDKGAAAGDLVGRMLRLAHTLKGAARVVKQPAIAELTHKLEETLAPHRDGASALPREHADEVLRSLDSIANHLARLGTPETAQILPKPAATPAVPAAARPLPPEEPLTAVRVEIEEMDALLEAISRVNLPLAELRRKGQAIEDAQRLAESLLERLEIKEAQVRSGIAPSRGTGKTVAMAEDLKQRLGQLRRDMASSTELADVELRQVRDLSVELRLQPAAGVFGTLERSARDAAQSLRKNVEFTASGGEIRLDTHVLSVLRGALQHVVRNAVAHGIESESARAAAGKPAAGRVSLRVERRGNRVAFICEDDGQGIDVEAIRRVAIARKILPRAEAAALSVEQVVQLMMKGGVTTAGTVTEISGRGIGLDVVRDTVARLRGVVAVSSRPGQGTTVEMCVPVSLSSLAALAVDAGGATAAIPLDSITRAISIRAADIARSADGFSIGYEGEALPFMPLESALQPSLVPGKPPAHWVAVIVEAGARRAAIGVDRLRGTTHVVVRPLPPSIVNAPLIAGVSLGGDGLPQLLLDPNGLVESARAGHAVSTETAAARRLPVLIIDDSLTTRMLEQSILTSAGYAVEVACSAEEGLAKAREHPYSLFVVDVEMPGMSGFEFVERTRIDPMLGKIPAILVTSRNAPEDKQRGKQAGAHAYIVKSEFDQEFLLNTIRTLIG